MTTPGLSMESFSVLAKVLSEDIYVVQVDIQANGRSDLDLSADDELSMPLPSEEVMPDRYLPVRPLPVQALFALEAM
ncbi:uncharacterized protein PITG_04116 [Phytophthora infestans T30-4]|uniref:Uncharacterized protein n=1 Tax=Phytophthora infestans (strain T30-4) TaxID=403677 RepID=D0N0L2_PHYIT|nr:uncharacterized protein PITG_04116 [Phytophthora infestans T30-4]EEY67175.1 conserved hypothetical protein [Phytophthora infestans T30-4]|eukprot:XP_002905823.1 conserved hypothetical protein [Phytophthora infestans T30-4]